MGQETSKILVVDDDMRLRSLLERYLLEQGYQVRSAANAEQMDRLLERENFHLMVLDLMLPGEDGLSICRRLRQQENDMPIIMLTAKGDEVDRIIGLEMGADDYLPKPCNPRELGARIRAIIRRTQQLKAPATVITELHGISLDIGARTASVKGRPITLTGAEFNALCLLMERAGQTISKQEMTQEVLSRPLEAYDRAMDVHISRIRQKLSAVGVNNVIKSIRKVGYQMLTSPQSQK